MSNSQEIKRRNRKMYIVMGIVLLALSAICICVEYKLYISNMLDGHEYGHFVLSYIVGTAGIFCILAFIVTVQHPSPWMMGYIVAGVVQILLDIVTYIFLFMDTFKNKNFLAFILSMVIFLMVSIIQCLIAILYYTGIGTKESIYEYSMRVEQEKSRSVEEFEQYNYVVENYNNMNLRIKEIGSRVGRAYRYEEENKKKVSDIPIYDVYNIRLLYCKRKPTNKYIKEADKFQHSYEKLRVKCAERRKQMDSVIKKKEDLVKEAERAAKKIGMFNSNKLDEIFREATIPAFESLEKKTRVEKKIKRSRKKYGK